MDSKASVTSVRVCCRFRPVNSREREEAEREGKDEKDICPIEKTDLENGALIKVKQDRGKPFTFVMDDVFWIDSTQEDVFKSMGFNTCKDVLKGYNGTILAYGQTGSGKTYSMYGPEEWNGKPISKLTPDEAIEHMKHIGIIPRCMNYIFHDLKKPSDNKRWLVKIASIEIYVDAINDLLNFKKKKKDRIKIRIRQLPDGSTFASGIREVECRNNIELMEQITKANGNRTVSATKMNATSSRSHSIVQVFVEQTRRDGSILNSKLNFVDLAGSEKVKKTGAKGQTLREAKKINKTLLTLGSVINALSTGSSFVPFRDSDLTYLLKDSLGGNTKTNLIICCSPHIWNVNETVSTLKFGTRCKLIKNTVKLNMELSRQELMNLVKELRAEIRVLQQKLASKVIAAPVTSNIDPEGLKSLKEELQRLKEDNKKSVATIEEYKEQCNGLRKQLGKETNERLKLVDDITLLNAKLAHERKEKDEEIATLTASLKEMKDMFSIQPDPEPEQEKKESELSKLHMGLMQGDLESKDAALKKMNEAIRQKNFQLRELLAKADKLKKDKSKQLRRNIELMDKVRDKDDQIIEYDNRCTNMENQNESLHERIEALEAEIEELREANEMQTGDSSGKQLLLNQQKYLTQMMSDGEGEEEQDHEEEEENKENVEAKYIDQQAAVVVKYSKEEEPSISQAEMQSVDDDAVDLESQKTDRSSLKDEDLLTSSMSIRERVSPEKWDVAAVCLWLKSINLAMYCDVFHENEIDGKLLVYTSFTDHMLKTELGVKALHVQKFRRELEVLKVENDGKSSTLKSMTTIVEELKKEESTGVESQLTDIQYNPSDDGLDIIRREFVAMDADNNGELDIDELRLGLHNLNIKASDTIVKKVFETLDMDKSGTIEEHELTWWLGKYVMQDPEATAQQIFDRALTEIVEVGELSKKTQGRDSELHKIEELVSSDSKVDDDIIIKERPSVEVKNEDDEQSIDRIVIPRAKTAAPYNQVDNYRKLQSTGNLFSSLEPEENNSRQQQSTGNLFTGVDSAKNDVPYITPRSRSITTTPKKIAIHRSSQSFTRAQRPRSTVEGLNKMLALAGIALPPAGSASLDCVEAIQDAGGGGKIKKIRFWTNEDETLLKGLQITYVTSLWKEMNSDAFISDKGGETFTEVSILPNDYIVHVLVTENEAKEISSLTIVTHRRKTYEVCDTSNMTNSVSIEAPRGFAIVGFFGSYNDHAVNSLGCYSCPWKSTRARRKASVSARRANRGLKFRRNSSIKEEAAVSWMDNRQQHRTLRSKYEVDIKETLKRLGCRGSRDVETATQIILTKYSELQVKKFVSGGVGTRKFEQQVMREIWKEITASSSRRRRRSKPRG